MSDLNIDSLQIKIASDASNAVESLDKLEGALVKLKTSLEGMKGSSRPISSLARAFTKLKDAENIDLSRLQGQLSQIAQINIKDSGVKSFISSLSSFAKVSSGLDFSSLKELQTHLQSLGNTSSSADAMLKTVTTFVNASNRMKKAANSFPALAMEIQEFFDAMANTSISDNTVRMAEALAQIASNGKSAGGAMQIVRKNTDQTATTMSRAQNVTRIFESALHDTVSVLRQMSVTLVGIGNGIGTGILTGIRSLVAQFRELTSASSGIKNLASNLKMLLGTFVGFYGIRSAFNWVKEAVTSGADVAETNHIIEATFGELAIDVDNWSQGTMESYGIAENAAKRYAGTLGAVFQSSGVGLKESEEMSKRLVEIAGDLSSFYNIDTETVYTKLKSGMAGMVRPLRKQYCACVQKCA